MAFSVISANRKQRTDLNKIGDLWVNGFLIAIFSPYFLLPSKLPHLAKLTGNEFGTHRGYIIISILIPYFLMIKFI